MADTLPFGKDAQPEYPEVHPRKYLTPKLKAQLALKQNGLCALCGCKPRAFEWDHIQELWAGGTNAIENWQGVCGGCHKDKSGKQAKHRAKMNRCRGKAGQVARRKAHGSKLKSRNTFDRPSLLFKLARSESPSKWGRAGAPKRSWPKGRKFMGSTRLKKGQA